MKTLRKEALAHQNNVDSVKDRSKVLDSNEESNTQNCTSSFFGPCCTNGCQYCRPNCHEKFDSSSYF